MAMVTIDDLMNATYQGNYYLELLGVLPSGMAGTPKSTAGALGSGIGNIVKGDLKKADDPFYTTKTTYYNPIFGQAVINWLNQESDVWSLLKKTTYQQLGDAIRILDVDASNFYGELETSAGFGDTDIPDLVEVEFTDPAVMYNIWNSSLIAQLKSTWQDSPKKNAEAFFREYFQLKHPSDIQAWLCKDTDTPAAGGGNNDNFIESIDRVCSDGAESAELSAPTDNDIYGFDRSANEAEAYVDLGAGGGALRDLDLGMLDDMLAELKKYSVNKRFILLTDEVQNNTIESLEATKHRISDPKWTIETINGVTSRKGTQAGFSVSSYLGAGLEVPIFTSKDIHAEAGGNGNIYCLDLDHIEIRVALPTVYLNTDKTGFLYQGSFQFKYMYLTIAQLIADQFNCHGAIKYLN